MGRGGYGGDVYRDLGLELQAILRGFLSVCVVVLAVLPGTGTAQGTALEQALGEMRNYRWDSALQIAEQDGQMARDIIEWHRLRAGHGTYDEVIDFLTRRGDWPGLALMRKNSEKTLVGRKAREVLSYFATQEPQTPTGSILFAQALMRDGQNMRAEDLLAETWREDVLSDAEYAAMITQFSDITQAMQTDRLDTMLWRDNPSEVARLLPEASAGWQALAKARQALQRDQDGVDKLIAAIPSELQDNPGLAYERFRWRLRKGRTEDAMAVMRSQSISAQILGRPEFWASERRNLSREMMWDGQTELAYELAANHHLTTPDANFADLEWIAGYLALSHMKDPDHAIKHFEHLLDAVDSPISLARAGYWLGRAYVDAGDQKSARIAFEQAAQHSTAYYGLLAAEALGQAPVFHHAEVDGNDWRTAEFTRSSVFQAGLISLSMDELYLAKRFFVQLSESLDDTELTKLSLMLEQMHQPHLALRVAKHGVRMGELSLEAYYPIHPMANYALPVNPELVMSIARRESEFDPEAVSRAGASGLLQLMPGTATQLANELGLPADQQRLVTDWKYNAALGSAYLAKLTDRFDGNIVLVSAAYNAGPNRVDEWISKYGDMRTGRIDVVDWVEAIPYRETRNYVMRVSESLPAYRARLGISGPGGTFSQELAGSTLHARSP